MRVIKNRAVEEDSWNLLEPNAELPESGDVIVSLEIWNQSQDLIAKRTGKTGVVLQSSEPPSAIQNLESAPLVAIDFPKFADGRGYSSARLLRDRLGYSGEVRAVGDVLRDQLFYMARCGIDSFALKTGKDIEGALDAFDDFSVTYQAAADEKRPLYNRVTR